MIDPTEADRREMAAAAPLGRAELEARYGEVYDTAELQEKFNVWSFMAPFVVVCRKEDDKRGILEFQHSPRFYYGWLEDMKCA